MRRIARSFRSLPAFLAVLLMWGCTSLARESRDEKDEEQKHKIGTGFFRHRWWNYYERALSYAEIQSHKEAITDLEQAIRQREEDQRMARTYGMHFIDYFPHRELGVLYYQMGDMETAERELELSLSHYPSAKAQFYLERVRKALLEEQATEVTQPRLGLRFDADEVWTRQDPVVVTGVAEDELYVAGITIDGSPWFLDGSKKRVDFEKALPLSQGRHVVVVEVRNLLGGITKQEVVVHVDRQGPTIIVRELNLVQAPPGLELTLSGFIHDDAGVSEMAVDGKTISLGKGTDVPFAYSTVVDAGTLQLRARDRLGNQTTAEIPVSPPALSHTPVLLACAGTNVGSGLLVALFDAGDNHPPRISLDGWTDTQTVYLEKVYIEGQVIDENKVASLTINDIPISTLKGQMIFFSHFIELTEGKNTVTIQARDEAGNRAAKEISILRKIPKALQWEERLSVTVLPLEQAGEVGQNSLFFQGHLIQAFVDQNRFRVIERNQLDPILQEHKLSQSELIDRSKALRLGKLATVHAIVTGSILDTHTGIEIVCRMIDTETSEIVATEDVYGEEKDFLALKRLAEGMAVKFHHDFPLVDGLVIEKKDSHIFIDLGRDKIKSQRRVLVFQETPIKHPLTGKEVGADTEIIGRAVIKQVMPEMSKAELMSGGLEDVQCMDKVITQ